MVRCARFTYNDPFSRYVHFCTYHFMMHHRYYHAGISKGIPTLKISFILQLYYSARLCQSIWPQLLHVLDVSLWRNHFQTASNDVLNLKWRIPIQIKGKDFFIILCKTWIYTWNKVYKEESEGGRRDEPYKNCMQTKVDVLKGFNTYNKAYTSQSKSSLVFFFSFHFSILYSNKVK